MGHAASRALPDWYTALPACIDVFIDHPRGAFFKRDEDGRIQLWSPLPLPFNYGYCPGRRASDGDQLDVLVLGPRCEGSLSGLRIRGFSDFWDELEGRPVADPKLICTPDDYGEARRRDRATLSVFFQSYARYKGLWGRRCRFEGIHWIPPTRSASP